MSSGRKDRVVIGCVTFETEKVVEPVKYYQADRAHIIHYVKQGDRNSAIYTEFYDEVCSRIRGESKIDVDIIEHNERVTDFSEMLRVMLSIIDSENRRGDCEIFVNISSGTPEYAAAATVASMMSPGTVAFSVNVQEYMVDEDTVRDVYFRDGRPVGMAASVFPPKALPDYSFDRPPEYLVRGLRLFHERGEERLSVSSAAMADEMRKRGIWLREMPGVDARRQSDAVNYHRDYIQKWVANGWIVKDDVRRRYLITEKGLNVIGTFYIDP